MSVLIKGMEMPTDCMSCRFKVNCDDGVGVRVVCVLLHLQIGYLGDLQADKRRNDCPLILVPPHGRLIDADALEAHGDCLSRLHVDYDAPAGHRVWRECVPFDDAPTIIPAEEGE